MEDKISNYDKKKYKIYYTPYHIIDLILKLFPVTDDDNILDCCCGDGRILKTIKKNHPNVYCKGIDIHKDTITYNQRENIYNINYEQNDFLKKKNNPIYSYSIINPPYGLKNKKTELHFVHKLLQNIKSNGKCICIIPQSVLFKNDKTTIEYKKLILDNNTLDGVITLNPNTFGEVGARVCLTIFTANTPHDYNNMVKFINFEDDGYVLRKHKGLIPTEYVTERRTYLQKVYDDKLNAPNDFLIKSKITVTDEWLHSFYYYNNRPPSHEMFEETMNDYLKFQFNAIMNNKEEVLWEKIL